MPTWWSQESRSRATTTPPPPPSSLFACTTRSAASAQQRGLAINSRIGLHTGPVIAGIIGRSKFSYDLWGDTVNTASRMESTAPAGTIQVSAATKARLGDAWNLEPRGQSDVKGLGTMETWLLRGRSSLSNE